MDFDGVLNNENDRSILQCRLSYNNTYWVGKLVKEFNYNIVISSSWKYLINNNSMSLEGMGHLLSSHGIGSVVGDSVIGVTSIKSGCRSEEIELYIQQNNITDYLILDDIELFGFGDRFLKCNSLTGFTEVEFNKLKEKNKK